MFYHNNRIKDDYCISFLKGIDTCAPILVTEIEEALLANIIASFRFLPSDRATHSPQHYAYLKISEGCDRKCSYCAIPIITGRHISKPIEEILDEVRYLVSQGVKEFQVIAQELTYYGVDLYKKQMLPELIERISEIQIGRASCRERV